MIGLNIHRLSKIVDGEIITKNKKNIVMQACIDSRELVNGGIFIVIGDVSKYSDDIVKKASVVIGEDCLSKKTGFIKVKNSLEALKKMARYNLEASNAKVIGITGSCGKTTLKELAYDVLSTQYKVLKNNGNENNIIGVSKTLLRLDETYDLCILEMGMNHSGEISELSLLTNPTYAAITNIGSSHIGYLGSKKEIFKAKMEILDGMDTNNIVVSGDDSLLKHLKCLKVGKSYFNDLRIKKVVTSLNKTEFDIKIDKKQAHIKLHYGGKHYPVLIGMAIMLGISFDIPYDVCVSAINNFEAIAGRSNILTLKNNNILIDDSYNASYESFKNVIDLVKKDKRKKLFIVGDVLEAGSFAPNIHLKIIKELNKVKNAEIWYLGENFCKLGSKIRMGLHFEKAEILKNIMDNDWHDVIFIVKASRKYKLDEISRAFIDKY